MEYGHCALTLKMKISHTRDASVWTETSMFRGRYCNGGQLYHESKQNLASIDSNNTRCCFNLKKNGKRGRRVYPRHIKKASTSPVKFDSQLMSIGPVPRPSIVPGTVLWPNPQQRSYHENMWLVSVRWAGFLNVACSVASGNARNTRMVCRRTKKVAYRDRKNSRLLL